jgi:predicted RNA-binding protein with PUA-like domain
VPDRRAALQLRAIHVHVRGHVRRDREVAELRQHEQRALKGLALLSRGNRLSITPVSAAHWKLILDLAK